MDKIKAVIFDFIGTLANLVGYSLEKAEDKLFRSLLKSGFNLSRENFFEAYNKAYQRHCKVRYQQLIEVTNAVWISEALGYLGYNVTPEDERINTAVNRFFEDYLAALKLRSSAKQTLMKLYNRYKLGIVTNYTYAPVIYAALRKLKINDFFNVVVVSEAAGWRKPNPKIFHEALKALSVEADEAIFVGDTPSEDIEGAKRVGMKTICIPSQFNSLEDMQRAPQRADYTIEKLSDILAIFNTRGHNKFKAQALP